METVGRVVTAVMNEIYHVVTFPGPQKPGLDGVVCTVKLRLDLSRAQNY